MNTGEAKRIRLAYDKRDTDHIIYSPFNPGHLFLVQALERELVKVFARHGLDPLAAIKALEVGCGTGWALRELVNLGAKPENLHGVDLLEYAIETAREISPNIDLRCVNGEDLPFSDGAFDMVMQFTAFTSILDREVKRQVAREMLRVLKRTGMILWYDYFISKPTNRDVRAIRRREIIDLFPGCNFDFRKVTLAPPIARNIAPWSYLTCYVLGLVPWLRTHYLVAIKPS